MKVSDILLQLGDDSIVPEAVFAAMRRALLRFPDLISSPKPMNHNTNQPAPTANIHAVEEPNGCMVATSRPNDAERVVILQCQLAAENQEVNLYRQLAAQRLDTIIELTQLIERQNRQARETFEFVAGLARMAGIYFATGSVEATASQLYAKWRKCHESILQARGQLIPTLPSKAWVGNTFIGSTEGGSPLARITNAFNLLTPLTEAEEDGGTGRALAS